MGNKFAQSDGEPALAPAQERQLISHEEEVSENPQLLSSVWIIPAVCQENPMQLEMGVSGSSIQLLQQ